MSSIDLPRLQASCVSYRASQRSLRERLVLLILLIHVSYFLINMDAQDAQDNCHQPPCSGSGHPGSRIA